jgi:transcriptional regulator with GAF, ATPase, and Fis domain
VETHPVQNDYHRLLATAALFQETFSIDWLMDLFADKKPSEILSLLADGVGEGVLCQEGPGQYRFSHPKKKDGWKQRLSEQEETIAHGFIADTLMRQLPDDDQKAHALAHHLIHIVNDTERCQYLTAAGDLHLNAFRAEDALQCYTKVLDDLSTRHGEDEDHLFARTAIQYSKVSTARHDTAHVLSILQAALERAEKRNLQATQAILKMHMAKNEWLRSRYDSAMHWFDQGWALAKELNEPGLMRSAMNFSTFFLYWQGRFKDAIQIYEQSVSDIENYPRESFNLLANITIGYCYAQIGQVTQGLGMLDAIRNHCLERGDLYLACHTAGNIGNILLDIGRREDAMSFLETSGREAKKSHNDWVGISVNLNLSYLYYLRGDTKPAVRHLKDFLQQSKKVQATVYLYPYLLELCLAMKTGKLPQIDGLSLEKEINVLIKGKNIFLKGVAYRFLAIVRKMDGALPGEVIPILNNAVRWLDEAGHQIELSKTRLELARQYLAGGEEGKAQELMQITSKILATFNEEMVPDDLRALIKNRPVGESLLKEIIKLGHEVVTIRDNKDLIQHIITTLNRITGAERGAIFLFEDGRSPRKLLLRASKNLTQEQISHESFASSMKMIDDVAATGQGRIFEADLENQALSAGEIIRSRICVPMILRDKTVGVLYHDNRLLSSAFKESDLDLISYFAAWAAFALDNVSAYEEIRRLNHKLCEENLYYKEEHLKNLHFEDIVGESSGIKHVLGQVEQVAQTDATVMIVGETGVGKELVARAIHRHSARLDKPFIRVHCSALPESLIPSELFGHEKGSFTGAIRRRLGRFELADGGTLFLDEIGDISPDIQVRLLRVLQTKEFERVGGSETLRSDFRLIVATNRNLEGLVKAQTFRSDLYYRLAVFPVYVPPLRERKEDIPRLAYYFLGIYSQKRGKEFSRITEAEMEKLIQYDWPGNVRELENIIERGTILSSGPIFKVPELGAMQHPETGPRKGVITLRDNERRHILWALEKTGWKVRGKGGAAELLDIPPSTLAFRMNKLGIKRTPAAPVQP